MNHSLQNLTCVLAIALGCALTSAASAQEDGAAAANQTPLAANLFNNYYTQGGMNQVNAQMYIAPRPVPAYVGHSYYTYQPLLPHEHMYTHVRNYYKWTGGAYYSSPCGGRCGGGCGQCQAACAQSGGHLNKTTVVYHSGKNYVGPLAGSIQPLQRLQTRAANYWYCPDTAKRALERPGSRLRGWNGGGRIGGGCAGGNCGGNAGGCAGGGCAANPTTTSIK